MRYFLAVGRLCSPAGAQMALWARRSCLCGKGSGRGHRVMHTSSDWGTWWHPKKTGTSMCLRKERGPAGHMSSS